MSRLAIYAVALAVLIGGVWWYGHSRYTAGERAAETRMQRDVDAANAETAQVEADASRVSEDSGNEIEQLRAERDTAFALGRKSLRPVRLCPPASSGEVPGTAGPAAATDGASTAEELPMRVGEDIGPALLVYAESCQRDHDTAVSWRKWWDAQDALRSE